MVSGRLLFSRMCRIYEVRPPQIEERGKRKQKGKEGDGEGEGRDRERDTVAFCFEGYCAPWASLQLVGVHVALN